MAAMKKKKKKAKKAAEEVVRTFLKIYWRLDEGPAATLR